MKNDTSKIVDLDNILSSEEKPVVVENTQPEPISVDWDSILEEWSYRCPKGYPTVVGGVFTERDEVMILNEILEEKFAETLPLPAENMQSPTIPLREVSDTDIKEWTVCIVADLCNLFGTKMATALKSHTQKGSRKPATILNLAQAKDVKELANKLKNSQYNRYLQDIAELTNQLNTLGFGTEPSDEKVLVNSIKSGLAINKRYGTVYLVRDEENFASVKSHATKLWKQEFNEQLFPDNWCPADIFVSKTDPQQIASAAKKTKLLVTKVGPADPLNGFFAQPTSKIPSGKFIGISLKQKEAQGGKGTKFTTNVLMNTKDVKDTETSSPLSKDTTSRIISYKAFDRYLNKPNKKDYKQPATKIVEKGNGVLKLTKRDPRYKELQIGKLEALLQAIGNIEDLQAIVTNPKKLAQQKFQILTEYTTLVDKTARATAKKVGSKNTKVKMFVDSRNSFLEALNKSKVKVQSITESIELANIMQQKLGSKFDVYLVQKIATYAFYVDVFNNWTSATKELKPYFKNISKVSNPFVALAMFCIGEAGITPPFTKLAADHWDDFTHDYIVDVTKSAQDVKVTDSPTAGGFDSNFKLFFGKQKQYNITLTFRFADKTLRVEVVDITGME